MGILDKLTGKKPAAPPMMPARPLLSKAAPQPMQPIQPQRAIMPDSAQRMPAAPQRMPSAPQEAPMPPKEIPAPPTQRMPAAPQRMPSAPQEAPSPIPEGDTTKLLPPEKKVRVVDETRAFTSTPEEAPVFVKLSRYEDLLGQLASMKASSVNVKALLQVLSSVRELEGIALEELQRHVDEMEDAGEEIDSILVKEEPLKKRVQEAAFTERRAEKGKKVESLEDKVRRLKDEIKSMSN